jgi:hypothetical protein
MTQQSGSITKLEWITCPVCSQTFQVAIPARATDMRVWSEKPILFLTKYCLHVRCTNDSCGSEIWIETNLPR